MKSVFVIWKDLDDGMWHPVAKLTRTDTFYRLNYTKGASHPNFIAFPRMEDKTKAYLSTGLFSFFKNRIIPTNRPEFRMMLEWSDIDFELYDELDLLGVSGGARKTDQFRIISQPEITKSGEYKIRFFSSGISHLDKEAIDRISKLRPKELLDLEFEDSNPYDSNAVMVMTSDNEKVKVGYLPKYFNCDIRSLLSNPHLNEYRINVVKVNKDAPAQFRLLCEFTAKWPDNFIPLVSKDYSNFTESEQLRVV
ncbi:MULTISPECIES: HIRAN domain-containing protein [unclassified Salinivibrio]|uniref:HIRAN domain-containing protein n=1 Tax=unclassified Salinivibrio TaxID=2636825 RepID=UPI0009847E31|nr:MULTISPECIES: HIRAN domain-containing protein [unclassified Salinivibrio]OOF11351.1 hypothetical protein BZG82_04895 [Salinivibrio sp. PR5]OOF15696.1 hypothetical protein BZG84_12065 [Salinivibrio sp. PR932]OOF16349.1 hypothetical protein BZG83_01050 [Salinivibrio sp. PR919]